MKGPKHELASVSKDLSQSEATSLPSKGKKMNKPMAFPE